MISRDSNGVLHNHVRDSLNEQAEHAALLKRLERYEKAVEWALSYEPLSFSTISAFQGELRRRVSE